MSIKSLVYIFLIFGLVLPSTAVAQASEESQGLVSRKLDTETYGKAITILVNTTETLESRRIMLAKLGGNKRELDQTDRRELLGQIRDITRDEKQPSILRSRAIRLLASLISLMQEEKQVVRSEVSQEIIFFMQVAADETQSLEIRSSAISAIDVLKAAEAIPLLENLLLDNTNLNRSEIVRPASLALIRLKSDTASEYIKPILRNTQDNSIFKTCAYCLGQLKSADSMAAIVECNNQFPDAGVAGFTLVKMEDVILSVLTDPEHHGILSAIKATRYLWHDGQQEKYAPLLHNLLSIGTWQVKSASIERLIEMAKNMPFQKEKEVLKKILSIIQNQPEFNEYIMQIESRLSATLLTPEIETMEGILQPLETSETEGYGNTDAQEYGDAVYRFLNWSVIPGLPNYNHAGIFFGLNSSDSTRVMHATEIWDTTKEDSFNDEFYYYGSNYYGAYTLSNETLDFSDRKDIGKTAFDLEAADIHYTFFNAIDWKGLDGFDGSINDIDNIRCDGVVEYCYENDADGKSAHKVWWNTTESLNDWNISDWPDVQWHNDMPGSTVDPHRELSPWAQRGAPQNTGPTFTDPNPNNTYLTRTSVINLPTYQITQVYGEGYADVTITAFDQSGIHKIVVVLPGEGNSRSKYNPDGQHPSTNSLSASYRVYQEGLFEYTAQDNGGNAHYPYLSFNVTFPSANHAPGIPGNEDPDDDAQGISITTDLDWSCSDPDGDTIYYTVFFEKNDSSPDTIIKNDSTGSYADPGTLAYGSHYYWKVRADDHKGGVTESPVWDFYTSAAGSLQVTLTPQAAIDAGAQWRVTSGPDTNWKSSGAIVSNIPFGEYTIAFKDISGYIEPSEYTFTIDSSTTYSLSRQYQLAYAGGNGTQNNPYQISTPDDLIDMSGNPAGWAKYFVLTADINLEAWTFTSAVIPSFYGTFNGNSHSISNLTINGDSYIGLFGEIANGSVTNLAMKNAAISGADLVGGLCGQNWGTITSCYSTGHVTGTGDCVGGLCGWNYYGTITSCYSTGDVDGNEAVGGLCGQNNSGTITNCYSTGTVDGDGPVGGLCGYNDYGSIASCYSTGTVIGTGYYIGGIGGLCGWNCYGTITSCYSTGAVTGSGEESYCTGGLCGYNYGPITNCYSSGSVTGYRYVGGFCGTNGQTVTDCYWDIDTSGQSTSDGGEGKTTTQMQDINTFLAANWDFENVWHMPYQSTGYPMLFWQRDIPGDFTAGYGVTLPDFAIFSQAWLTSSGQPGYNENCDLVDDNTINLADLTIFAENFLQGL